MADAVAVLQKRSRLGWIAALLAVVLLVTISYLFIAMILPPTPSGYAGKLLYPLLVLFKSSLLFHPLIFFLSMVTFIIVIRNKAARNSGIQMMMSAVLIACCGMIVLINLLNIFTPDYRHHDSIRLRDNVYQLGTSTGPDWPSLQYLVYQCDQYGLICELISVPHSGIDRSQLPNGTIQDRTARFLVSEDRFLNVVVDTQTYSIQINP